MAHLTDEEVDVYVGGRLPSERLQALEEHYLECAECLERIRELQDLVQGLREGETRRAWRRLPAAAAVLAAVGLILLLQVFRLQGVLRQAEERLARGEAWPHVRLEPVERGAAPPRFDPPRGAVYVVISIDAAEVATPGAVVEVVLLDSRQRPLVRFSRLEPSPEGLVSFPVPISVLAPGELLVEVGVGSDVLRIPFGVGPSGPARR